MIIPMNFETPLDWLNQVGRIPLLGGIVALFFCALPAPLIALGCTLTGTPQTPTINAIALGLATVWGAFVWYRLKTKIRIVYIPAPLLVLAGGVASLLDL